MIAKISKGSTFAGIGRYLYSVGKAHEAHTDPRVVAGDWVMRDDTRGWRPWVADMVWCAEQRPDVARPVWHCSLRAAPEDRLLTDDQWAGIAREHIEAMGLAANPWVAVRHGDDHVHIVACRIDATGRLWRDSHDYARAEKSARAIEQRHGLAVVDDARPNSRLAKTTASERAQNERRNRTRMRAEKPERVRLATRMRLALTNAQTVGGGLAAWHRELDRAHVEYKAITNPDGIRVIGYRASLPGWTDPAGEQVWLKASQVDRRLSWPKLRAALGVETAGADRPPRTAAQLAAQAFPQQPAPARPSPTSSSHPARPPIPPPQRDPRGRGGPHR